MGLEVMDHQEGGRSRRQEPCPHPMPHPRARSELEALRPFLKEGGKAKRKCLRFSVMYK